LLCHPAANGREKLLPDWYNNGVRYGVKRKNRSEERLENAVKACNLKY
jgi:hypothetical protein